MAHADSELNGLRALDPAAITEMHDRYYPDVYRYVRYRLGDDEVAQDLASDVFVRLLEAVHAGRWPTQTLRGWLMGTASHLVMDHFRRFYAGRETTLGEDLPASDTDPTHALENGERRQAVHSALSRLTAEQQHVLALRFGSGYSLEETALAMGKKANAIKALQFRALAALRRGLNEASP
ncbi:MAG TPA: sigma-70 family RNA polymerase sigma factor [Anaerolineales bacterium]|nr:sigma-70 family RNA polymerase sigma factor [Anaerolineales bacterium]